MKVLTRVKAFFRDLLLWSCFVAGLAASSASGTVLDGTQKNVATYAGIAVSMLAGTRIAKKPKIKAFLSRRGTLWFLFLFNAGAAAAMYFAIGGVQGIMGAVFMGLVSLGAASGLVAGRRKPKQVHPADLPWS